MVAKVLFTCEFCGKHFKTENGFIKHHCEKMQRNDDFKSIAGQAALRYYSTWMWLKHYAKNINPETFKTSAYFTSFLKFYAFVQRTQLPSVDAYIKLMVRKKIDPRFWDNPDAYGQYLEYITYQLPLSEHVAITVKTLFDCAEAFDIDVSDIFKHLTPNDVIQLLHQRKLSPWLLLKSRSFADFVINGTNNEERLVLTTVIKPEYWQKKYEKHPKEVETLIEYISEMGL